MFKYLIKSTLGHPFVRNLNIDSPETTIVHSRIINEKPFLKKVYKKWYDLILDSLPLNISGPVIELGSGGGFLKEIIPGLITSEIFHIPNVDIVLDGQSIPFKKSTLQGIVMVDVFHHIPNVKKIITEVTRCMVPGGVFVMIEPWNTKWSRFVYKYLHHESFDPFDKEWEIPKGGPLSQANSALPWMVFERDREKFKQEFPELKIQEIELHSPFCYLLSGGVSLRNLIPGCLFGICQRIEDALKPWMHSCAMFAKIVLSRK